MPPYKKAIMMALIRLKTYQKEKLKMINNHQIKKSSWNSTMIVSWMGEWENSSTIISIVFIRYLY